MKDKRKKEEMALDWLQTVSKFFSLVCLAIFESFKLAPLKL